LFFHVNAPKKRKKVQAKGFNLKLNNNEFVDVSQDKSKGLAFRIVKDDPNRMDTQEIKDLFGKNVKYFRFQRQLSQAALAEKADISVTFLSNIERGKMFPKVETLSRLTESLEVEIFELFRVDPANKDNREIFNQFSDDIINKVILAMEDSFKRYCG
jgi:transcriptional regulator with XRE-family HTH domain